jgi:hypothetical protein
MAIDANAMSGPVPTSPDSADTGSTAPTAALTTASTARTTAAAADLWCSRTVKRATTSR